MSGNECHLSVWITKELQNLATESRDGQQVLICLKRILERQQKCQEDRQITSNELSQLKTLETSVFEKQSSSMKKLEENESLLRIMKIVFIIVTIVLFAIASYFIVYAKFDKEPPIWSKISFGAGGSLIVFIITMFVLQHISITRAQKAANVEKEEQFLIVKQDINNKSQCTNIEYLSELLRHQLKLVNILSDDVEPVRRQAEALGNRAFVLVCIITIMLITFMLFHIITSIITLLNQKETEELENSEKFFPEWFNIAIFSPSAFGLTVFLISIIRSFMKQHKIYF